MSDEKNNISLNIDVGAKAEIKGEVPSSSMGRLVDSLTDAIRPFTEARGLKADQIRLQREDVLIEIAQKAKHRISLENQPATPVPLRVLVPLVEKASLADADSEELKVAWANLLVAASQDGTSGIAVYSDILSKLDPIHIRFLNEFGRGENGYTCDLFLHLNAETVSKIITDEFLKLSAGKNSEERLSKFDKALEGCFKFGGAAIVAGFLGDLEVRTDYPNATYSSEIYNMLEALSILKIDVIRGEFSASADDSWLKVVTFTPFGFAFFQACSDVKYLRGSEVLKVIDTLPN